MGVNERRKEKKEKAREQRLVGWPVLRACAAGPGWWERTTISTSTNCEGTRGCVDGRCMRCVCMRSSEEENLQYKRRLCCRC